MFLHLVIASLIIIIRGGSKMKTRKLILVVILLAVVSFLLAGSYKKAISEEDFFEAFNGTWVNPEYSGYEYRYQKRINYLDREWELYPEITSTRPQGLLKGIITDKWIDSEGAIWYKAHWEAIGVVKHKAYEIGKINNSGNTLELIYSFGDNPIEEWELDNIRYTYVIYYRQ